MVMYCILLQTVDGEDAGRRGSQGISLPIKYACGSCRNALLLLLPSPTRQAHLIWKWRCLVTPARTRMTVERMAAAGLTSLNDSLTIMKCVRGSFMVP